MTEAQAISQIPTSFYIVAGTLIVANIGTVVTVLYGIGKLVWWMSKLDSRVEAVEKLTADDGAIYKDVNAAHRLIRELKNVPRGEECQQ